MQSDQNIPVSIAVLTYNRAQVLDTLLTSLKTISYSNLEIIVVDNHSEDGTEKLMNEKYPGFVYLRTDRNIGVGARNIGLKRARGDIVICLDDDVFGIDDAAIMNILEKFRIDPRIGASNFKVLDFYTGRLTNWIHHCRKEDYSDGFFKTYEITEGAVAFRKEALERAGFYPEYFFISHEGPDLAFRLINEGYDVVYSGDVSVRHCHSDLGRKSWYSYYFNTRNQYWLAARNFPISYALKYLFRGQVSTLIYSIRDGFFKYWIKAVKDGLLGLPRALDDRKIVTKSTRSVIKEIDKMRPSLFYMVKERVFHKGMRL
jgi:GT2 family glycosyltransferase